MSKSYDHIYEFRIMQLGNLIDIKYFNDYSKARSYYGNAYDCNDFAIVPYYKGKLMSFNLAYDHFDIGGYHMRYFGRKYHIGE